MKHFTLMEFVAESNRIEDIDGALPREVEAHVKFLELSEITVADMIELVSVLQPDAQLRNRAGLNVRVGNYYPPFGGEAISYTLQEILQRANMADTARQIDAYNLHHDYETLHPFTDGNGRSGRALWLWVMGGIHRAPLGFLHHFYYQSLSAGRK